MSAPRLEVDLTLVEANARSLVTRLAPRGIGVTAVTKALLGSETLARAVLAAGVTGLGDARVANVARLRAGGLDAPITLIRSSMPSEVAAVVATCDTSLETEPTVLAALSVAALAAGRVHGVVLMVELGDLREGILGADLEGIARLVLDLEGLELHGIGTNLACRSGVVPDERNMAELSAHAAAVEARLGVHLRTVSGGSSANLGWALAAAEVGRVDDLRIGEAILLGRDPTDRRPIAGLRTDAIAIVAEVIESKVKPSVPWGDRGESAFGIPAATTHRGDIVQTILAIGRQDVDVDDLTAPPGVTILAASSDHLVVETLGLLAPGAELSFRPGYAALLRAATSPFVHLDLVGAATS